MEFKELNPLFPPNTKPRTLDMFMGYYSVCKMEYELYMGYGVDSNVVLVI